MNTKIEEIKKFAKEHAVLVGGLTAFNFMFFMAIMIIFFPLQLLMAITIIFITIVVVFLGMLLTAVIANAIGKW